MPFTEKESQHLNYHDNILYHSYFVDNKTD